MEFLLLKTQNRDGAGLARPLNNDVILARNGLDTTPAGTEVNKTSLEVEGFLFMVSILSGF